MAKIDLYVRSMERFGARGVLLRSNANVTLRFPTGDRHATQTTSHAQLRDIVGEIAPHDARSKIASQGGASFEHAADGKTYRVTVQAQGQSWSVQVEPAGATPEPAPAPAAAPPTPAAAPSMPAVAAPASMRSPMAAPSPEPASMKSPMASPPPAATDSDGGGMEIERTHYDAVEIPPGDEDLPIQRTSYTMKPAVEVKADLPAVTPGAKPLDQLIDKLLVATKTAGASDLHLCTGCPPLVRLHGEIRPLEGYGMFDAETLHHELMAITPEANKEEFAERNDTDFGYSIPKLSRFRANLFRDRKGPGAVFRAIPFEIPTAQQLGIPERVLDLCNLTKGLVLVTGPTGSGKSTTLAALIDHINQTRSDHLITIEDPIEFMHPNKKCLVNQREVYTHTKSFKNALRAALREDPDIVLVGEMRDLETIHIAIETAETGHLVFGTLHTTTAPGTVDRLIDQFPADRQEQIRTMLAESLKGVISQVLCKKKGGGRVAAHEILISTSAVSNLIREKKTFQLFSIMQTGRNLGMQTMNDALINLVKQDLVEPLEAYKKAVSKDELKGLLERLGHKI